MGVYAKAWAAAIVGALITVALAVQAAATDDSISREEWIGIAIVALGAIASALGVRQVTNAPPPDGQVQGP